MSDWQAFIESQPKQQQDGNFICDASDLGLILVTGDDAKNFLQNQFSNDIAEIDQNHFQLSSYSSPKGRMLAIFRIVQIDNGYLLICPSALLSKLIPLLQMYVVHSQVSLADASAHFSRLAIMTDQAGVIEQGYLPKNEGEVRQSDSLIALNLGKLDGEARFLLLSLVQDEAITIWNQLCESLQTSSFDSWRLSEIKAGIPVIYPETSEEFVAQMANLNLLGGVNFKKGCYPGQEIVARMQYLGKLKRRMFLARIETNECPAPGDDLVGNSTGGAADGSGKIVEAVLDHQGHCYCLYIAQIKKALDNSLRLLKQPEAKFLPLNLPYPLADE
ncbi:MAG: folate-binding protein [Gammaproteobacteria bacterium]|nr:folate-binding protein [Gammaproteobacteria bacterium]